VRRKKQTNNVRFCGEERLGGVSDVLRAVKHAERKSGEEVT